MNDEVIEVVAIDTPNADVQILEEALGALGLAPSSFANLETGMATTFLLTDKDGKKIDVQELLATDIKG